MKQILSIAFVLFFNTLLFFQIDLVPYRIKYKWGYSNFKGDIIINTKYDSVGFFKNIGRNINVAFVEK